MRKKFFSGDSVRQALLQAGRYFQIEPEQVAYREVERRHGFLRGRRRAVIEVDLDNPERPAQPEEPAVAGPEGAAPASDESTAPSLEAGRAAAPLSNDLPTDEMPIDMLKKLRAPTAGPPAPVGEESEPVAAADDMVLVAAADERRAEPPAGPAADPETLAAVGQALDRIFELGRLDLEVESIEPGEEKLEIELRGEDEEYLLEDRGRLLLAIQHLLPRMLRGLTGKSTPCLVDCDDFHEIRTEQLRDLAQRVASEVRNRRRSRTLEPMSPDERRIVHLTLADDPAVETVSQGNGLFKRVQIRPQKMQPRGFDPFARE